MTTPIYYPNDLPHIGHFYSSLIADISARYKRLLWYNVKFSTGVDENSQKIVLKAQESWQHVMEYLDEMSPKHQELWSQLQISYTDFIRTTNSDHKTFVQSVLQKTYDQGDIYQAEYEWLYCVWCESFKKESDLIKNSENKLVCPDHLTEPQILKEKNRFFRLSKYQDKILEFYEKNPDFVLPHFRFNEAKAFVKGGLEDFSISRETNTFGIPLPFDPSQVTYVWYDALLNYLTVCQHGDESFWPANLHVLGKDISRFHAIYWPAMLMAAGYALPHTCFVTGFFTVDGQKMSKSLGNTVKPLELLEKYDRDGIVMYLFYDVVMGSDGDFSFSRLDEVYNSMLIGGRWNLVSRVSKFAQKNGVVELSFDQVAWELFVSLKEEQDSNSLFTMLQNGRDDKCIESYLENGNFQWLLRDRYQIVQMCNKYIDTTKPWEKIKQGDVVWWITDLKFLLYMIKNLSLISAPFFVNGFKKIQTLLGNELLSNIDSLMTTKSIKEIFDIQTLDISLNPINIYVKYDAPKV